MTDDRQPHYRRARTRVHEDYGKRFRVKGRVHWRGAYFYRGQPWHGPSNALGRRR